MNSKGSWRNALYNEWFSSILESNKEKKEEFDKCPVAIYFDWNDAATHVVWESGGAASRR